jgi:RNA polymerase sigma-70 factor, ECF subfamily
MEQAATMKVPTGEVDAAVVAAFCRGDRDAFDCISRRHFRELHIHCYRMVGSFDEAEDLVQETLLRGWRNRDSYEGRATIRAWLYRIATNACIDAIRRRAPRGEPIEDPGVSLYPQFPWLQPYPDALLDTSGGNDDQPDARLVARETIELAFLATIQLLPAKQRAVLILRDVLDFSASETAQVLDDTPAAVNSALQRARDTIRRRREPTNAPPAAPAATFGELVFLQLYMDASERGDLDAIVELLRDDVQMTLLPDGLTWDGRSDVACEFLKRKDDFADVRMVAVAANRQPAVAVYRRRSDDAEYHAWAVVLLGVVDGKLREIASFASPELFARFDLPLTLPDTAT